MLPITGARHFLEAVGHIRLTVRVDPISTSWEDPIFALGSAVVAPGTTHVVVELLLEIDLGDGRSHGACGQQLSSELHGSEGNDNRK